MSKKKDKTTVSDASDAREADSVVTADELVNEPTDTERGLCVNCTAELGDDGICPNCRTPG